MRNNQIKSRKVTISFKKEYSLKKILNISGIIIFSAAIVSVLIFYAIISINSINIAIFGSYINDAMIKKFENKENVHVRVTNYDSNENLEAKLLSSHYDLMMPSDYAVATLNKLGYIQKFDWNTFYNDLTEYPDSKMILDNINNRFPNDDWREHYFVNNFWPIWNNPNYIVNNTDHSNLINYQLPFSWGSLCLIANSDRNNTLGNGTWDDLFNSIMQNKKILLSDDVRNTSLIGQQLINLFESDKAKYISEGVPASIVNSDKNNLFDSQGMNVVSPAAFPILKNLFRWLSTKNNNISFHADDIQDYVSSGNFDYALIYNTDALYSLMNGNNSYPNITSEYFEGSYQGFGNNFWTDGFALSNKISSKKKNITYKLLAFLYDANNNFQNSDSMGITSPVDYSYNKILEKYPINGSIKNSSSLNLFAKGPIKNDNILPNYIFYKDQYKAEYAELYTNIISFFGN